jgi:hypothetical protein
MKCRLPLLPGRALFAAAVFSLLPAPSALPQGTPPVPAYPPPFWWYDSGAVAATGASDFAAINQGQLKTLARAAWQEMEARLRPPAPQVQGAGQVLDELIAAWDYEFSADPRSDYAAVNLGQLKTVAAPFYARMEELLLIPFNPQRWSATASTKDYAMANIGQAKTLFDFDYYRDSDSDSLEDYREVAIGTRPLNPDTDGDGIDDGTEVEGGLGPLNSDSDKDGAKDGDERNAGTDPKNPDTDGDGALDGSDDFPLDRTRIFPEIHYAAIDIGKYLSGGTTTTHLALNDSSVTVGWYSSETGPGTSKFNVRRMSFASPPAISGGQLDVQWGRDDVPWVHGEFSVKDLMDGTVVGDVIAHESYTDVVTGITRSYTTTQGTYSWHIGAAQPPPPDGDIRRAEDPDTVDPDITWGISTGGVVYGSSYGVLEDGVDFVGTSTYDPADGVRFKAEHSGGIAVVGQNEDDRYVLWTEDSHTLRPILADVSLTAGEVLAVQSLDRVVNRPVIALGWSPDVLANLPAEHSILRPAGTKSIYVWVDGFRQDFYEYFPAGSRMAVHFRQLPYPKINSLGQIITGFELKTGPGQYDYEGQGVIVETDKGLPPGTPKVRRIVTPPGYGGSSINHLGILASGGSHILLPVEMMVDADRDGELIQGRETTSEAKPLRGRLKSRFRLSVRA